MILNNIKNESGVGKVIFWWGWGPLSLLTLLLIIAAIGMNK